MYPITPENAPRLSELAHLRWGFITDLAWSPDGTTLALAHSAGMVWWRGGFGGEPAIRIQPHDGPVKSLAFSPDGRVIASASADTTVKLSASSDGRLISTVSAGNQAAETVAFSPDGRRLAFGGGEQIVHVVHFGETPQHDIYAGHSDEISALAFGNGVLASSSRDGTIRLWQNGQAGILEALDDGVRDIAFGPGSLLASGARDGTVRVWDTSDGSVRHVFAHDHDARAVTFNPAGTLLAAADGSVIRLWAMDNGYEVARLSAHDKPVLTLAFHPRGDLLVSGSGDNTVRLWGVDPTP